MKIETVNGMVEESTLFRTVGVEDRPSMMALYIEWREEDRYNAVLVRRDIFPLPKAVGDTVFTTLGDVERTKLRRTIEVSEDDNEFVVVEIFRMGDEIVKRSPNVILKRGVEAAALIGGF